MEINKIHKIDVLDGLRQLPDNSIDVIITSPPYNKMGLNHLKQYKTRQWHSTIDYNCDSDVDNMPEDKYQEWQLEILNECYRVLKPDGSMFYNHKDRIVVGKGEIVTPYQWLLKSPFKIRQEIIWDRKVSPDVNVCRFLPSTEKIYWLAKSNKPAFNRKPTAQFKGEVWTIVPKKNTKHPAPFPIEIPDNILCNIPNPNNDRIVLDPFMGSGTVAVAAINNGFNYLGFELFQEYIDMANERTVV